MQYDEYYDDYDYNYYEEAYDQIADELDALYSIYDEYDLYHNAYYDTPNSIDPALQTALNTELSTLGRLDFSNNNDWDTIHIINNAASHRRRMQAAAVPAPAPKEAAAPAPAPKAAGDAKPRRKDVFKEGYEMGQLMKPQEETKDGGKKKKKKKKKK